MHDDFKHSAEISVELPNKGWRHIVYCQQCCFCYSGTSHECLAWHFKCNSDLSGLWMHVSKISPLHTFQLLNVKDDAITFLVCFSFCSQTILSRLDIVFGFFSTSTYNTLCYSINVSPIFFLVNTCYF